MKAIRKIIKKTIKALNMKSKRGFTLVEILITLTIIGGLFSFGYANLRNFSQRQATINASREVESAIKLTREFALAGNKPSTGNCVTGALDGYKIQFNDTADTYSIYAVCSGSDESVGRTDVALPPGIDLTLGQPETSIIFKTVGDGTDIPEEGSFVVITGNSGTENSVDVQISSSGEISSTIKSQEKPVEDISTPSPSPSPSPTGSSCQGSCRNNVDCAGDLICSSRKCVNESCPSETDCVCNTH